MVGRLLGPLQLRLPQPTHRPLPSQRFRPRRLQMRRSHQLNRNWPLMRQERTLPIPLRTHRQRKQPHHSRQPSSPIKRPHGSEKARPGLPGRLPMPVEPHRTEPQRLMAIQARTSPSTQEPARPPSTATSTGITQPEFCGYFCKNRPAGSPTGQRPRGVARPVALLKNWNGGGLVPRMGQNPHLLERQVATDA